MDTKTSSDDKFLSSGEVAALLAKRLGKRKKFTVRAVSLILKKESEKDDPQFPVIKIGKNYAIRESDMKFLYDRPQRGRPRKQSTSN